MLRIIVGIFIGVALTVVVSKLFEFIYKAGVKRGKGVSEEK